MRWSSGHPAQRGAPRLVLSVLLAGALVVVLYAVSPWSAPDATLTVVGLVAALVGTGTLTGLRLRRIRRHHDPRGQAVEALALVVPLFVVAFAWAYGSLGALDQKAFSEPVSRLDAVYFTVVVLSTVGFGDISPVSELARLLVTTQIVLQLTLLGLGFRLITGTARQARDRQAAA